MDFFDNSARILLYAIDKIHSWQTVEKLARVWSPGLLQRP